MKILPPLKYQRFGTIMEDLRARAGYSRPGLAKGVCDQSYLTRFVNGEREPPNRDIIERLANKLNITAQERDNLLVSAGYAPVEVDRMGQWDPVLAAVTDVLVDGMLSPEELEEFRNVVYVITKQWRRAALNRIVDHVLVSR